MRSPRTNEACAGQRTSRAGAGQSTESSDAKSERGEKDRVGWRLRLRCRCARHVDGVGTFQPTARELDGETIRRARGVVDQPGTVDGAGDIAIPIGDGTISRGHVVGTLADVASGTVPGRTRPDEITVFKSEGFALEDLVAARLAYTLAQARGIGREVRL